MTYFKNIDNLEQAKLQHRKLAKKLHPDNGGSSLQFQRMEAEYRTLLLQLQNKQPVSNEQNQNDIVNELSKLAMSLIKKQIPQDYLKRKMKRSSSPVHRFVLSGILQVLDSYKTK